VQLRVLQLHGPPLQARHLQHGLQRKLCRRAVQPQRATDAAAHWQVRHEVRQLLERRLRQAELDVKPAELQIGVDRRCRPLLRNQLDVQRRHVEVAFVAFDVGLDARERLADDGEVLDARLDRHGQRRQRP
jgi:hypothetical protein